MELREKLRILSDAAKYDAACTSSGVNKRAATAPSEAPPPAVSATRSPVTGVVFRFSKCF